MSGRRSFSAARLLLVLALMALLVLGLFSANTGVRAWDGEDDETDQYDDDDYDMGNEEEQQHVNAETTPWENSEVTTAIWRLVSSGQVEALRALIDRQPDVLHLRSADGRGLLWWAYEYGQTQIVELAIEAGARTDLRDAHGYTPEQVPRSGHSEL